MIAKKFRFHGHGGLKFVFSHGQSARSRFFSMRFVANPRQRQSRLAVIVSKKISKSSVKRNRIRRRVYEILRPIITASSSSTDIVISVFSPEVLTADHDELVRQLTELNNKINEMSNRGGSYEKPNPSYHRSNSPKNFPKPAPNFKKPQRAGFMNVEK